jgi:cytochrome c oxidase cbb3-type subunit 3
VRTSLVLGLLVCLVAAILVRESLLRAQLLRGDPAAIPDTPALMAYALPRGEQLYQAHCSVCHGPGGIGDSRLGVPDLRDNDWLYGTGQVSDIEQVIRYGIRSYNSKAWNLASMPAYATAHPSAQDSRIPPLSPANIGDVTEFLIHLQGGSADAAKATRGAAIFSGAGGCYDCHGVDAKGDSAIGAPNLTDSVTLYGDGSRESLEMSIGYGRAGICPAWVSRMSAAEIRKLAVFVYTLSHPGGP